MSNMPSKSPSEILYDELVSSANSNRRENAQNIKAICGLMDKDKVEITLSGVAKRCLSTYGAPAVSTVTNTGSKLGEYVRLRKQEQKIEKGKVTIERSVSAKLQDPVIAQEVKILEEMIKGLRNENNALRTLYKKLETDVDGGIKQILLSENSAAINKTSQLNAPKYSSDLKDAVMSIFKHLSDRGYGMYRGRFGINKSTVLTLAELKALKDVLGMSESEFHARFVRDK